MNTTTASPIHDLAVATDTVIGEINGKIAKERYYARVAADSIERAERLNAGRIADGLEPSDRPYGIDIEREQYRIAKCNEKIAALEAEAAPYVAVYNEHRWSRFFLVLNTNGHIHSSTSCHTCFFDTEFGWLPQLSGLTEVDAVADQGEILCSVCFPSAPVEWTNGTSNNDKAAKAEREAAKAERLAKKTAKALVPDDIEGGLVVFVGNERNRRERLTTLAAAKTWLTNWAEYYDFNRGGHPSYPNDVAQHIAQVLAARIDSTPEAEIEAARKRAAKRR